MKWKFLLFTYDNLNSSKKLTWTFFFVHGTTLKKLVLWRPQQSQTKSITSYYGISPLPTINFLLILSTLRTFNFNFVYDIKATYELAKYKMSTIQPSKKPKVLSWYGKKFIQSLTQRDKPFILYGSCWCNIKRNIYKYCCLHKAFKQCFFKSLVR